MKDTTSIFFPVTGVDGDADERRFNAADFAEQSEHIVLSTGVDADGQPEGCYVNYTESFGGTFTGV